jgi:outer membrane protein assembly factor BamB
MKSKNSYLYIYAKGRVAKINKQNGEIAWETRLNGIGINKAAVGNLQLDGSNLYVGANGILVCLNEPDGSIVWTNPLKGWGYSYIIFANQNQTAAAADAAASQSSAAATVAAT